VPLLVVGADHPIGAAVVRLTAAPDREVRAFVSDPEQAFQLKSMGAKVAIGDLSDEGHIGAAATRCFSVAFVIPALDDGRELAFADRPNSLIGWARAAEQASVTRVIWIGGGAPESRVPESAHVSDEGEPDLIASRVAEIDDLAKL
jgi:uncharacterized protein YbjT (DUF2867 family)